MRLPEFNLARLILYLALAMIALGIVRYGIQPAVFERGWRNLLDRPNGSLALRFVLQPLMASILAIRDGIRDARTERSPYLWAVMSEPAERAARLREGIAATGKIFLIAIVIDIAYQILELKEFYPGEAIVVAALLAFVPYFVLRGTTARLVRRLHRNTIS